MRLRWFPTLRTCVLVLSAYQTWMGPLLYPEVERRHPELLRRFIFPTGNIMSPETAQFPSQTVVPCLRKPLIMR
jgi:hypothetical protein